MSRIISANKLNRFWKNGIIPIKNNLNNKIKTKADLMANTVEGYVPDALAVKEGLNEINDSLVSMNDTVLVDLMDKCESVFTPTTAKMVVTNNGKCRYFTFEGILNTPTGDTNIIMLNEGTNKIYFDSIKWGSTIAFKFNDTKSVVDEMLFAYTTNSRVAVSCPVVFRNTPIPITINVILVS